MSALAPFPATPKQVASATNSGISLTIQTDAQRTGRTPALNEIVYASDTHLFYLGDGTTGGGVAQTLAFTPAQLRRLGIIEPRGRNFLPLLRAAASQANTSLIPALLGAGNSHMANTGATTGNGWTNVLGTLLSTYAGVGTASQWTIFNMGVGGSTIAQPCAYLADNADTSLLQPRRSVLFTNKFTVGFLMSLRNDASASAVTISVADYTTLLRAALIQIKKQNAEAVFITDPPKINYSTGAILDTAANWDPWYLAALQVAGDEGATVVDAYAYFTMLAAQGVSLIPFYSSDGTHLIDLGHTQLANLVYQTVISPSRRLNPVWDRPVTDGRVALCSKYTAVSGSIATLATGGTSAITTPNTARKIQTGEGGYGVYQTGTSRIFAAPAGVKGVIVVWCQDASNTGTATLTYNSQTVASADASCQGTVTREFSKYYSFSALSANSADMTPAGRLTVAASGGNICVFGIIWVMPTLTEMHSTFANSVETGTWSASTLASALQGISGLPGRQSATIGDTKTYVWYGSSAGILAEQSSAAGKISYQTDGGTVNTNDLYSAGVAAGTEVYNFIALGKNLTEGWHTTTVTVVAKNASSSGNTVSVGNFSAFTAVPDPSFKLVSLAAGETMNLLDYWKLAAIDSVISGSPTLQFSPGASTVVLGGTGAAVVRLTR